ncbi:MAG: response regulator [Chloroflexi bacterium]|nr:response regulator [Chloroflexota bacterium]NOG66294.1 response regulator [Chloroflexota bacterium]
MMTDDSRRTTRPLPPRQRPPTGQLQPATGHTKDLPALPWMVRLEIMGQALAIQLAVPSKIVIGRTDPEANMVADVDLGPFRGIESGVSRRHAEIQANEQHLLIVDLGSTNGTRLNGHRLLAHEPYRLRHGDTLSVGLAELKVYFTMQPVHEGVKVSKSNVPPALTQEEEETEEISPRRILVVDSDEEMADALNRVLDRLGYRVTVASSAGDAMRNIASQLPHAVFVDLNMPDFPGTDICRMIRSDLSRQQLPVFMLSKVSNDEDIQRAMDAGATLFLSKPVGMNELVEALNTYVGDPTPPSIQSSPDSLDA